MSRQLFLGVVPLRMGPVFLVPFVPCSYVHPAMTCTDSGGIVLQRDNENSPNDHVFPVFRSGCWFEAVKAFALARKESSYNIRIK